MHNKMKKSINFANQYLCDGNCRGSNNNCIIWMSMTQMVWLSINKPSEQWMLSTFYLFSELNFIWKLKLNLSKAAQSL